MNFENSGDICSCIISAVGLGSKAAVQCMALIDTCHISGTWHQSVKVIAAFDYIS